VEDTVTIEEPGEEVTTETQQESMMKYALFSWEKQEVVKAPQEIPSSTEIFSCLQHLGRL
jgi:hypothetical protein